MTNEIACIIITKLETTMAAGAEISPRRHQLTNRVVMVHPTDFAFNPETAVDDKFMTEPADAQEARRKAIGEFTQMVSVLKNNGIFVAVLGSREDIKTPDGVFPNNWLSTHEVPGKNESQVVIYPMNTPSRRAERQINALRAAINRFGIDEVRIDDMSADENEGKILEGTGSLVLDRQNGIAYAHESQRTTKEEFDKWVEKMGYEGVFFHAASSDGTPVYHTNVVMSVGDGFSVLCSDVITSPEERAMVEEKLLEHGELITITEDQMNKFAGNILQLKSETGDSKIVMSQTAFDAFTPEQRERLEQYGDLVPVEIPTIEKVAGGSARCMIAEVFPPKS